MQRRKFGRELELEAVRLVKGRGVAVVEASSTLEKAPAFNALLGEGVVDGGGHADHGARIEMLRYGDALAREVDA